MSLLFISILTAIMSGEMYQNVLQGYQIVCWVWMYLLWCLAKACSQFYLLSRPYLYIM